MQRTCRTSDDEAPLGCRPFPRYDHSVQSLHGHRQQRAASVWARRVAKRALLVFGCGMVPLAYQPVDAQAQANSGAGGSPVQGTHRPALGTGGGPTSTSESGAGASPATAADQTRSTFEQGRPRSPFADPSARETSDPNALVRRWSASVECMTIGELNDRVGAQLAGIATDHRTLEGEAHPTESGWQIRFVVFEDGARLGERVVELEGTGCREHDDALLLIASLLLEHGPPQLGPTPEQETLPEEAEPPLPKEPEPPEPKPKPRDPPPQPEPGKSRLERWRVGAGASILSGWLPRVTVGPWLSGGVRVSTNLFVEAEGGYFPSQVVVEDSSGGEVKTSAASGLARLCADLPYAQFSALGCFGLGWLGLFAEGRGVADARKKAHHSPAVSGSLGASWHPVHHLGLFLAADLEVPLRRGEFGFAEGVDLVQVHETNQILPGGRAGVTLRF